MAQALGTTDKRAHQVGSCNCVLSTAEDVQWEAGEQKKQLTGLEHAASSHK